MNKQEAYRLIQTAFDQFHKPEFIHPDPLEAVLRYADIGDREIAGFIASAFAMGRVSSIEQAVHSVLSELGEPKYAVMTGSLKKFRSMFGSFVHRFFDGEDLARMLCALRSIVLEYGSIHRCFSQGVRPEHDTVLPALISFTEKLHVRMGGVHGNLIPVPERGSACKRLLLYLRWMVRSDAIDPGGWTDVPKNKLLVPMDVHMLYAAKRLGLTNRKQADMKTALEVTDHFRRIDADDPVKFDFSLTRLGIHPALDYSLLVA